MVRACVLLTEDGPNYSPRIAIGPLPEMGPLPRHREVDIMHTVSPENPLRQYNVLWQFRNPLEMCDIFLRVREEIFKPFAEPYLRDAPCLCKLVSQRCAEVERNWHTQIVDHNEGICRKKAEKAFRACNYTEYLTLLSSISQERHSDIDKKRIAIATSKSGGK